MIISLEPIEEQMKRFVEEKTGETIVYCESIEKGHDLLSQAEIIIGWSDHVTGIIEISKKLKWIYVLGAGVENLPFEKLLEKRIVVTNAKGLHGSQMAEHTLGMMIMFSRKLVDFIHAQERKEWLDGGILGIDELTGKTLCVIGAGSIGSEIARKAKAFDMKVIGIKNHPTDLANFDNVTGRQGLQKILGESDYIVLTTPLTPQTYGMIGEKEFAAMKKKCVFINLSRGDTVDETALIEALLNGTIAGAGLDVFHDEPLPATSPLWEMKNVIITPHIASMTPYYMERAMQYFCDNLIRFRSGKKMGNTIDLIRGY